MLDDEANITASRAHPKANLHPAAFIQEKPTSPWIPFSIALILILAIAGGGFLYMDMQFKILQSHLETKLLKTNDFVVAMDQRLKKIEDSIASSDADADAEGSSLTSKMLNMESRVSKAEKNIGWNSSRIAKQVNLITAIETSVSDISATLSGQVSANTSKIEELFTRDTDAAQLSQVVESNSRAIETIDAHRTRLSSAIQKVQEDTATLIRLYEKDNPTAKRVQ